MPVWLQILLAFGSTFGMGSFALELLRRHNAKKDKSVDGEATIVVKQIDDGAQQREGLWRQMELLRVRLEKQEAKTDRIKATVMRMWEYEVKLRAAWEAAAQKLTELGHPVPIVPPQPLSPEEVFEHE